MAENEQALTPANANPWYVLMTLYGEQTGVEVDEELHEKNRAMWNAWSCQAMDDDARAAAAASSYVTAAELSAWPALEAEVTKRHKAEMLRRNGKGFAYPGLPDVDAAVDLTRVAFAQPLVLSKAVFSGDTQFASATFSRAAWFHCATFSWGVGFDSATFSGYAGFRSATFGGAAWFDSAMFSRAAWFDSAMFSGAAGFDSATFSGDAGFRSATFGGDAGFRSATFSGDAGFRSATFSGAARFAYATFGGDAGFGSAMFSGDAGFGSATFGGDAGFRSATFSGRAGFVSATFSGAAWFRSATFSGAAWFDFATFSGAAWFDSATFSGDAGFRSAMFGGDARFGGATFSARVHFPEAKFGEPKGQQAATFIDCQFAKPTNFRKAIFHARYPDFAGAVLHDKTTFTDHPDHWPKGTQGDLDQAKASCATIRHNLGKQGLPEAEHFFFRREMGFAGQTGPGWQRPPYWMFGWVSDYGYSIVTPFLWLCLLIVGGAYALAFGLAGSAAAVTFEQGLGLSFANVFNFLAFHKTFATEEFMGSLPPGLKALSGFQSIFGVVLLFFLGLGLRTRFRMR
jgi:Pentapeptide repeats (9 copies)